MYSGQGTTYYSIFEAHSPVLDDQLPLNDEQLPTSLDPLFLFPDTEQYPVSVPIPIPLEPRGIDTQTQQMSTSASFLAEFSSDKCSFFDHSPSMEDIISSVSSISPPYTIDGTSNQNQGSARNRISADRNALAQLSQFSLPSLFSVYMDVPHEYFPSFRMDSLANLYPTPFLEISTPDVGFACTEVSEPEPNDTPDVTQHTIKTVVSKSDAEIHPCQLCGMTFARNGDLRHHSSRCGTPRTCKKCGTKFGRRQDLRRHETDHCNLESQKHKCPFCGRCFCRKDSLRRHVSVRCAKKQATNKSRDLISSLDDNKFKMPELSYNYAFARGKINFIYMKQRRWRVP